MEVNSSCKFSNWCCHVEVYAFICERVERLSATERQQETGYPIGGATEPLGCVQVGLFPPVVSCGVTSVCDRDGGSHW